MVIGVSGFEFVQDLNREGRDSFTPRTINVIASEFPLPRWEFPLHLLERVRVRPGEGDILKAWQSHWLNSKF